MSERGSARIGLALLDRRSRGGVRLAASLVWVLFIIFPVLNAVGRRGSTLDRALTIAGALAFLGTYVALVLCWRMYKRDALYPVLFAVLLALATALTLAEQPGWGFLFTYCAACAGMITGSTLGFVGVGLCTALAGGTSLISDPSAGGAALGFAASSAGIGLLMMVMRDLRTRNEQLIQARAELAELAVAKERERFARDLHDLLGHSLSVIALKAELAGRLIGERPEQAAREVAEVEKVARGALSEVREAVSGYRQPTLADELAGARMALAAAGITAEIDRPAVSLDPAAEAVLAWAVREGATNVIRHSSASRCVMKISASLSGAVLEVVDDGVGAVGPAAGVEGVAGVAGVADVAGGVGVAQRNGDRGHGLAGLMERAETVRGRVEAGAPPEGGFRLAVSIPATPP